MELADKIDDITIEKFFKVIDKLYCPFCGSDDLFRISEYIDIDIQMERIALISFICNECGYQMFFNSKIIKNIYEKKYSLK